MTDLPTPASEVQATAASDTAAPTVNPSNVVTSVVQTVQSHPAVAPENAASVITSILAGLAQAEPAIFAVSRASSRTQAGVSLGVGLAEVIVSAFLQRPH